MDGMATGTEQQLQRGPADSDRLVLDLSECVRGVDVDPAIGASRFRLCISVTPVPHPGGGVVLGVLPRLDLPGSRALRPAARAAHGRQYGRTQVVPHVEVSLPASGGH